MPVPYLKQARVAPAHLCALCTEEGAQYWSRTLPVRWLPLLRQVCRRWLSRFERGDRWWELASLAGTAAEASRHNPMEWMMVLRLYCVSGGMPQLNIAVACRLVLCNTQRK